MDVDLEDFEEEFCKKFQWNQVQDDNSCRNCCHFRAQLQPNQLQMMYDNPSSSFINRYEKGEMGGCEKASKMATRATRFDYPLFFTEVIGHCLLHKARKTSRYLNFRLLITIIQFNNWVRKESARRKSERKEIAKLVKHDIAEVKARKLDLA